MRRQLQTIMWASLLLLTDIGNAPAAPIRVLILSGQTVHDVATTTPFLEALYKADAKRFTVVQIVEDVSKITPETFAPCDVIVSNWTCHPVMTGGPWTAEGKQAFADAITRGKGMVSFHAASAACNDWADFQEISGLTWKLEHTSHTTYHTFKVTIDDNKHAITKGLTDFWITDELYQRMVKMGGSEFRTLASAFAEQFFGGTQKFEPMLITTQLGKGRGVNFLLGHDVRAMRNPAWQTIMLRATEWAATGKVTVPVPADWPATPAAAALVGVDADATIAAATAYAHGSTRESLFLIEQMVIHASSRTDKNAAAGRASLAGKLGAAIPRCATPEAKSFLCSQLGVIGTAEQVPAVAPLLADEETAMMARFALEHISGPAAAAALRESLPRLHGTLLIGAINSIGERRDADSAGAVAALLGDADPAIATAAAAALGKIGTAQAWDALRTAHGSAPEALRPALTDACLACGERLLAAGDKQQAAGIGKLLYAPAQAPVTRAAALRLVLLAQPTQATSLMQEALETQVPEVQIAVAQVLREQPRAGDTRVLSGAVMRTSPDVQPILIAALADRGDKAALPSLRRGLDAEAEPVRLATLGALACMGEDGDVLLLADKASEGSEVERRTALEGLRKRPGHVAEDAIVNLVVGGKPAVRKDAAAALVIRPAHPRVFELLAKLKDAEIQTELVALLPQVGDEQAFAAVRQAMTAESPAVRQAAIAAMLQWPTAAPLDTLLDAAGPASDPSNRLAVVQAALRMLPAADLEPAEKASRLARVLQIADKPEDRKQALTLLSGCPVPEALATAMQYTEHPESSAAAVAAALRIAPRIVETDKEQVRLAMRKLIATARAGDVIQQADAVLRKAERPTNLARGATADSPDGLSADGAAGGDEAGIDGDPATYWDEVDDQKLYRYHVTFKEPTRVSAIVIKAHAFESHAPKDFDIVCDEKVIRSVAGAVYERHSLEAIFHFEPVTCRCLELRITGYYARSPAIRELEIYDWPKAGNASQPAEASRGRPADAGAYSWAQSETSLALVSGDRIVWRLNYDKKLPKVYFDPVNLPDGTELVWLSPPDHEWHFALWFSWKELNGLNYWEQWNTPGQGRTELADAKVNAHPDHSADFAMTINYRPDGGPSLLTEARSIKVHPPDAGGAYRIDWSSTFQAGSEDVHLKGGTAGGGYAGLSVRISPRTRDWQLTDSEGRRDMPGPGMARNTHGQKAKWSDFSLVGMLTGLPAGITIFDHPSNLRHPSAWHNLIDDAVPFGYFSPALLWSEPYTLKAGDKLTLRYRILVHPGRTDSGALEAEFQAFSAR